MTPDILGLRDWRLRKGIALDDISQSTKLSVRLLEAIECGDFSKLPGGIYNTNYIRQYARAIDFDEAALLAYYYSACKTDSGQRASRAAFQL
jgi:cytoskeletal protein RodZ